MCIVYTLYDILDNILFFKRIFFSLIEMNSLNQHFNITVESYANRRKDESFIIHRIYKIHYLKYKTYFLISFMFSV